MGLHANMELGLYANTPPSNYNDITRCMENLSNKKLKCDGGCAFVYMLVSPTKNRVVTNLNNIFIVII